jgi:DNA-binding MarR family transcriptional regulator
MANESFGRWISLLYRYGHIYVTRQLEPFHIGKGQFLFLLALYHKDGLLQDELAKQLNIDKGTTARALYKLEEEGYVIRKTDDKDRRSNHVYLTKKAEDFKPQLHAVLLQWTDILCQGLSENEREQALSIFKKLADNAATYMANEKKRDVDDHE